jgi:hypothetical protein
MNLNKLLIKLEKSTLGSGMLSLTQFSSKSSESSSESSTILSTSFSKLL